MFEGCSSPSAHPPPPATRRVRPVTAKAKVHSAGREGIRRGPARRRRLVDSASARWSLQVPAHLHRVVHVPRRRASGCQAGAGGGARRCRRRHRDPRRPEARAGRGHFGHAHWWPSSRRIRPGSCSASRRSRSRMAPCFSSCSSLHLFGEAAIHGSTQLLPVSLDSTVGQGVTPCARSAKVKPSRARGSPHGAGGAGPHCLSCLYGCLSVPASLGRTTCETGAHVVAEGLECAVIVAGTARHVQGRPGSRQTQPPNEGAGEHTPAF